MSLFTVYNEIKSAGVLPVARSLGWFVCVPNKSLWVVCWRATADATLLTLPLLLAHSRSYGLIQSQINVKQPKLANALEHHPFKIQIFTFIHRANLFVRGEANAWNRLKWTMLWLNLNKFKCYTMCVGWFCAGIWAPDDKPLLASSPPQGCSVNRAFRCRAAFRIACDRSEAKIVSLNGDSPLERSWMDWWFDKMHLEFARKMWKIFSKSELVQ